MRIIADDEHVGKIKHGTSESHSQNLSNNNSVKKSHLEKKSSKKQ